MPTPPLLKHSGELPRIPMSKEELLRKGRFAFVKYLQFPPGVREMTTDIVEGNNAHTQIFEFFVVFRRSDVLRIRVSFLQPEMAS